MQKILSSLIFREYRQYSPQQLAYFRRSASLQKQRQTSPQAFSTQKIQATKQSEQSQEVAQKNLHVQVTQFETHRNQLDELGDAVTKIETKIEHIFNNQRNYVEEQHQHPNLLVLEAGNPSKEEAIEWDEQPDEVLNSNSKQKQMENRSYLKNFRQLLRKNKQISLKKSTHKFNLQQFKNKLNYTMYNKIYTQN